MIDVSYIHAGDDIYMIESVYEQNNRDIKNMVESLNTLQKRRMDLKQFELFTEAAEEQFEESVKTFVTNVGEKILKIIAESKARIAEFFLKHRDNKWRNKETAEKIRMIEARDPETAKRVQIALSKGDLDMNSFKDIKDFFDNCDKVLTEIEKRSYDPKSLKGRIEKMRQKIRANDNGIKTTIAIIGAVVGVGGLIIKFKQYKQGNHTALDKEAWAIKNNQERIYNKMTEMLTELDKHERAGDLKGTSERAIIAQLANEVDFISGKNIKKRLNLSTKINMKFFDTVNRLMPNQKKTLDQGIAGARKHMIEEQERARRASNMLRTLDEKHSLEEHNMNVTKFKERNNKP